MKIIAQILSFYLLLIAFSPAFSSNDSETKNCCKKNCCASNNADKENSNKARSCCTPLSPCSANAGFIIQKSVDFNIAKFSINQKVNFFYEEQSPLQPTLSIWQPPKL